MYICVCVYIYIHIHIHIYIYIYTHSRFLSVESRIEDQSLGFRFSYSLIHISRAKFTPQFFFFITHYTHTPCRASIFLSTTADNATRLMYKQRFQRVFPAINLEAHRVEIPSFFVEGYATNCNTRCNTL